MLISLNRIYHRIYEENIAIQTYEYDGDNTGIFRTKRVSLVTTTTVLLLTSTTKSLVTILTLSLLTITTLSLLPITTMSVFTGDQEKQK